MPVETSSGFLSFALNCIDGATAQVFIDSVFVSNQVSPDDMDNISLLYTVTGSPSTTSSVSVSTSVPAVSSPDGERLARHRHPLRPL